ncbi:putative bifunctional diguanylate cyclase/phosphodiesterase [Pseudofrankia inefficax]|uniref:Diguanylate cyclase/phosphodiesterase n=1 Tax=Pseudofrankia inefficax (strain DSM 45817 / CECT 9037 / DDB 130130 / EuI1c) TaxID=298654 RepID=E3JBX7_PSEI1|nr:diguanylate cyclase [Pseudofrankia inefficax]ADP82287.1 diguanylate cyclase/phosphodiesterase [Pseudofrankia inefficax]
MVDGHRTVRVAAGGCLAYLAVVAVCALLLPSTAGAQLSSCAAAAACLAVVVCLVWTGRRAQGADRRWRLIIGIATIPTVLVSAWHLRWIFGHGAVVPAHVPWAAAAFLLIFAVYLAGILAFPTDPLEVGDAGFGVGRDGYYWYAIIALDSLVVVGSVFLIAWATIMEPAIRSHHIDTPGLVSNTGTVVGYLILMAAVLLLATFRQPRSGLALALLGAGMSVMMLSTALYLSVAAAGGVGIAPAADVIAATGWLLLLLAGLVPIPGSPAAVRRRGGPRVLWLRSALPYLALGVAGVLLVSQLIADGAVDRVEWVGLIGLLLIALARQLMTLGENTVLLASVEASRQELRYQALHDPLTGLANRALFADRLQHALAFRESRPFALVYCDLDDFKRVNDTLGHAAGDSLLTTTAARLRAGVRPGDTIARLGGDEFAILLGDGHGDPEAACQRLAETIRAPTMLAGHPQPVGASLGLVIADAHSPPAADALLREADLAMYAAKREGKGGLVVYRPDLSTHESAPQTRAALAYALRGDERYGTITVHYQPVVDLRTGGVSALDAVPHWSHRLLAQSPPDLLAHLADEAGLTVPLVGLVLRRVCRDVAAQNPRLRGRPAFVSVPVRRDLEGTSVAEVADLLAHHDLPPQTIILRLSETCGVSDLDAAAPLLRRLAGRGIRLALDGVGGRASTFAAWRTLPIEIIRLDHTLTDVDSSPGAHRTRRIRDAVLAAAAHLDLTVATTGIGNHAQARELAAAGCHLGTGPYYGPPRPLDEASQALPRGS